LNAVSDRIMAKTGRSGKDQDFVRRGLCCGRGAERKHAQRGEQAYNQPPGLRLQIERKENCPEATHGLAMVETIEESVARLRPFGKQKGPKGVRFAFKRQYLPVSYPKDSVEA